MRKSTIMTYFFLFLFYFSLFFAATVNFSYYQKENVPDNEKSEISEILYPSKITAVIDGDTVKVQFKNGRPENCEKNEIVRLIGVNTPELNLYTNRYYKEEVNIQLDNISAMRDKYGRLLAYVWLCNSTLLNKNLIEDGYGRFYNIFLFNEKLMKEFSDAEILAIQEEKGIWGGR